MKEGDAMSTIAGRNEFVDVPLSEGSGGAARGRLASFREALGKTKLASTLGALIASKTHKHDISQRMARSERVETAAAPALTSQQRSAASSRTRMFSHLLPSKQQISEKSHALRATLKKAIQKAKLHFAACGSKMTVEEQADLKRRADGINECFAVVGENQTLTEKLDVIIGLVVGTSEKEQPSDATPAFRKALTQFQESTSKRMQGLKELNDTLKGLPQNREQVDTATKALFESRGMDRERQGFINEFRHEQGLEPLSVSQPKGK
jgi:hypothetical protein